MKSTSRILILAAVLLTGCGSETTKSGSLPGTASTPAGETVELLNVSYDPTRELWKDLNSEFAVEYQKSGKAVKIKQSHGGSGTQARAVIDGLEADVVSLAMWQDTDQIRKTGLMKEGWEKNFPNRSLPYTST